VVVAYFMDCFTPEFAQKAWEKQQKKKNLRQDEQHSGHEHSTSRIQVGTVAIVQFAHVPAFSPWSLCIVVIMQ
jgi:membrane protein YqaA with SNARE-associated domain